MNRVLALTGIIAVVFLLRILIYSYGYTKAQIGGAEVSKNIRLFMGDHLKRIPLSRFTQGQTGDYINTITSDVNNYEKILTHKVGDLAKNFALSLMLIVFVVTLYVPAGIILLIADLLLIPGLWLSFRMVRKYGKEKNDICAENVSSIVEYVSGIQTFRAYGVGGLKNKTIINAMREFCRISFVYEAKVLPIGAGFGILSWLSCPLVIWTAYAPWAAGTLDTVSYLLICMLPLFCAKLANSIFVDLTSYKNLMISKNKILGVMNEPEETGSMEPLQIATHEITFDSVDFSYVPGEPVLKHATFTVPDQKLTAIAALKEKNLYVRCFLYELATKRFSDVMWAMQQIMFKGLDRRLAEFLFAEAERTGSDTIRMTHEQIAQHISSAREAVARMLKSFSEDGLVELKRGAITLRDKNRLNRLK